jgi:hypothetical protein
MIYYQGKAKQKSGKNEEARGIFQKLIEYGIQHLDDEVRIDYFAVSLPDFLVFEADLQQQNRIHCHYMMALGYLGLHELDKASKYFDLILIDDVSHLGAVLHSATLTEDGLHSR